MGRGACEAKILTVLMLPAHHALRYLSENPIVTLKAFGPDENDIAVLADGKTLYGARNYLCGDANPRSFAFSLSLSPLIPC